MLIGVLATLLCISLFSFDENEANEDYETKKYWIGAVGLEGWGVYGVRVSEAYDEQGNVIDFIVEHHPSRLVGTAHGNTGIERD